MLNKNLCFDKMENDFFNEKIILEAIVLILKLAFFLGFLFLLFYVCDFKHILKNIFNPYIVIILICFLSRIFFFKFDYIANDLNDLIAMVNYFYKRGINDYHELKNFKSYTLGQVYLLYGLGIIQNVFKLSVANFKILLKLQSVLFDILTGILVYKVGTKEIGEKVSFCFALIYILNPAIIFNSVIFGQLETLCAFFIFMSIYLLYRKKYLYSLLLFLFGTLIQPQMLIFSPIFIYAIYDLLKENKFDKKTWSLLSKYILCLVLIFILFLSPFVKNFNFVPVISEWKKNFRFYNFATVDAFNIYMYLNLNQFKLPSNIFLISFEILIYTAIFIFAFWFLKKSKSKAKYFFCAGMLNILVFVFCFDMNARFIFPSLLFFLMSFIFHQDKKNLLLYFGFSWTAFINFFMVLNNKKLFGVTEQVFSIINIILAGLGIFFANNNFLEPAENKIEKRNFINKGFEIKPAKNLALTIKLAGLEKKDWLMIFVISFFYGIIAFYNLGDIKSPQSFFLAQKNDEVVIDFSGKKNIDRMQILNGVRENKTLCIFSSQNKFNWHFEKNIKLDGLGSVFKWKEKNLNIRARYLKIRFLDDDFYVHEIGFRDKKNNLLELNLISERGKELFDEQDLIPNEFDYKNNMYFDEVYHARTGYEFLHGLKVYETTHPPLGKNIIAAGIKIFGMTPFGYRFFGALCGVLMLPVFYILAKKIFDRSLWAVFATVLFSFDFMHFEQTRIATIDSYTVFFVMLMFLEIYVYYNQNFFDMDFKKNIKPLFLCVVFSGLACSVKWQGFYALFGVFIIFLASLFFRYREYLYAIRANKKDIKDKFIILSARSINLFILFMVFVFLPIYFSSYFLYAKTEGVNGFYDVLKNQDYMFSYHAYLKATHPFSSRWWQWILNLRPILFYTHKFLDKRAGISCFANPIICYGGLIGFFYCLSKISKAFDRKIFFLLVGYLSMLWPWIFIKRPSFAYHYLPCIPFLILMLVYVIKDYLYVKFGNKILFLIGGLAGFLFIMFYPVLSGLLVPKFYIDKFLKWFVTWQLY